MTRFSRRGVLAGMGAAALTRIAWPSPALAAGSPVKGHCDPAFARVKEAFEENFRSRQELGAAVAVYKDGKPVVDLWGGIADPHTGTPWERDTIVHMQSVGKSMMVLSVLMLVDRGRIDLDAPVARYWPEFAQNGKEKISVRTLMQGKAGLIYADAAPDGSMFDLPAMFDALARQKPEWEPGTKGAYHSMSMGYLMAALIEKVDGRRFNIFFEEEVSRPIGADYRYGLDDERLARTAFLVTNPDSTTLQQIRDRSTKLGRAWHIRPAGSDYNSEQYRRSLLPSGTCGNARGIGRVYAALANGGSLDGVHLISRDLMEQARTEAWKGTCQMTDRQFRYGLGFFLNYPPLLPFGTNPRAFGHPGAGGAIGFADPENRLAFSYSPNFMCGGAGVGDRCEALINATYNV